MTIDEIIWSKQRITSIFDAAEILKDLRKEAIHEPTQGWDLLYNAQKHLVDQLELKEAA